MKIKQLKLIGHKNVLLVSVALALLLGASSCIGNMVKRTGMRKITVSNKAIPPDFGKDSGVLICIVTGKNRIDKYIIKHVKKEYHGRYEFVKRKDLDDDAYSDTAEYRFVFDATQHTSSGGDKHVGTVKFIMEDRKTNKKYHCPFTSGFYAKVTQAYMINLEKQRRKYHPKSD